MTDETLEQQMKDSDIIFTAVTSGAITKFEDAQRIVVLGYVPDMQFSRSGISHALKRLEKHYKE